MAMVSAAKAIFCAALDRTDAAERAAYVAGACGRDEDLRRQVEALLSAHVEPDSRFDHLTEEIADIPSTAAQGDAAALIGSRIGPYNLRELLGEGGMGAVYVAEQSEPVRRHVALKIIKPGMDSRHVIARFQAERQALALMDHTHIARALDAGATASGHPYFVMELVRGTPITTYCDQARLPPRRRLELFVTVCQAIQHAHQKGIIHRDLKPGNVLVTQCDGAPLVKVIDFGVAKALHQPLTDRSLDTSVAQLVGTPLYMSPEQAELGGLDVDTRSDVYSLGVLLYELLTGQTPFDRETLRRSGLDEMRRLIRDVDPPRPSQRFRALTAAASTTEARHRGLGQRELCRLLGSELDWIVMQCLEKDRNRRYESASALALDIERYLADEPVLACPPSTAYRLSKFARRNMGTLVAAAAVLMALVAGTCVATWQAIEANRARRLADERLAREEFAHRRAEENAQHSRRLLYAADVRLAGQAWQRNDVVRMRELLARHVPRDSEQDLRGFEWHYLWKQLAIEPRELCQADGALYFVCFSPNGKLLACTGKDARVRLFDSTTLEPCGAIETGQTEVNGLAFAPDSQTLASAGDDGTIALWDVATHREKLRFRAHATLAYQAAFTPDGKLLASCGREPIIRLWDPVSGASRGELKHHTATIESIAISKLDELAAGDREGKVSLWKLADRTLIRVLTHPPSDVVSSLAFSPPGRILCIAQINGVLSCVQPRDIRYGSQQMLPDGIQSIAFSQRFGSFANVIAAGDRSGTIRLLPVEQLADGSLLQTMVGPPSGSRQWPAHQGRVYSLAFTPRGRRVVSAGEDGRLRLWPLDASDSYHTRHVDALDVAFLDSNQVALSRDEGSAGLELCSAATLEPQHQLASPPDPFSKLRTASAVRRLFAVSTDAGTVHAWHADGTPAGTLWQAPAGHDIRELFVTPDGQCQAIDHVHSIEGRQYLELLRASGPQRIALDRGNQPIDMTADLGHAAYARERDIVLLATSSSRIVQVFQGHQGAIKRIAFAPDGNHLGSVSGDRTVKVWNWRSGELVWSETAHENSTNLLAFSPDGQTIATIGDDGMLRFWRWQIGRLALELPLENRSLDNLVFSPDGLRLLAFDSANGIEIFDAAPSPPIATP